MIGVVIINFLRPDCTIKCVNSLLKEQPDIQIYLGDQDKNSVLENHFTQENIHWVQLPFDCGIGYARNLLITQMLKDGCDYFMWADNDFMFDSSFKLDDALSILKSNKRIGIVGGSVKKNNKMCHYERFMYYDRKRGILTYVPIELSHPEEKDIDGIKYFDCDITFNFAIAKKAVWEDTRVHWYEGIKCRYEHSQFFLQIKRYSKFKVVYCPSMSVHHEHTGSVEYKKYRFRQTDAKEFSDFFKLKAMYEVNKIAYDFTNEIKLENKKIVQKKNLLDDILNENCLECLEMLNSKNIVPVVLNQSCLSIINKEKIIELFLGYTSEEDLQEGKKLFGEGELWEEKTKDIQLGHLSVKVPYPVVQYLKLHFGENCLDEN